MRQLFDLLRVFGILFGICGLLLARGIEQGVKMGTAPEEELLLFWPIHLASAALLYWSAFTSRNGDAAKLRRRFMEHRSKVAWAFLGVGGFATLSALTILLAVSGEPVISEAIGARLLGTAGLGIPTLAVGTSLLVSDGWPVPAAKAWSIVVSSSFPLGTILAIYCWWALRGSGFGAAADHAKEAVLTEA